MFLAITNANYFKAIFMTTYVLTNLYIVTNTISKLDGTENI